MDRHNPAIMHSFYRPCAKNKQNIKHGSGIKHEKEI